MPTVKAITFIVDSLLSRPKLDYDVGYDAAVKGASVVVSEDNDSEDRETLLSRRAHQGAAAPSSGRRRY